jgi:hypothetical protein
MEEQARRLGKARIDTANIPIPQQKHINDDAEKRKGEAHGHIEKVTTQHPSKPKGELSPMGSWGAVIGAEQLYEVNVS